MAVNAEQFGFIWYASTEVSSDNRLIPHLSAVTAHNPNLETNTEPRVARIQPMAVIT